MTDVRIALLGDRDLDYVTHRGPNGIIEGRGSAATQARSIGPNCHG